MLKPVVFPSNLFDSNYTSKRNIWGTKAEPTVAVHHVRSYETGALLPLTSWGLLMDAPLSDRPASF